MPHVQTDSLGFAGCFLSLSLCLCLPSLTSVTTMTDSHRRCQRISEKVPCKKRNEPILLFCFCFRQRFLFLAAFTRVLACIQVHIQLEEEINDRIVSLTHTHTLFPFSSSPCYWCGAKRANKNEGKQEKESVRVCVHVCGGLLVEKGGAVNKAKQNKTRKRACASSVHADSSKGMQ